MQVGIQDAYNEACAIIGELMVAQRLSAKAQIQDQIQASHEEFKCAKCGEVTDENGHGPGVGFGLDGQPLLTCEVGGPNDPNTET